MVQFLMQFSRQLSRMVVMTWSIIELYEFPAIPIPSVGFRYTRTQFIEETGLSKSLT